jgi:Lrp/AsnC family transcriptional regulator, leucine-responsive regulatory protein
MADFEAFTRRLLFDNANVRHSNVVVLRDQVGAVVPV